jgi:hypothetical protein
MFPTHLQRALAAVTGAKTLAASDSGIVQNVTASATVTLPATAVGMVAIIRNGGQKSVTINVSPNSADKIIGNGFTATDDKDAINTLGVHGDEICLLGDGSLGWYVVYATGDHDGTSHWTREA